MQLNKQQPENYDLFSTALADQPKMTNAEYTEWHKRLSNQERIEIIRRFKFDNDAMPFEEILFAIKRGESLHVRSAKGEWLKSYSWTFSDTKGYEPNEHDWTTNNGRICSINDIPFIGSQQIDGEPCNVVFYRIGDLPIWRTH